MDELEKRLDWISEDTVKINDNLDTLNYYLEHEMTPFLYNIGSYTNNLDSIFTSITNFYFGSIKNPFKTIVYDTARFGSPIYYAVRANSNSPLRFLGTASILAIPNYRSSYLNLFDLLASGILNQQYNLGSLNNYAHTNLIQNIFFHDRSLQLLQQGFAGVSNSTIKPYIDELYKSPLDEVTSDFYAYLTNSYLSAYSGTNPNTNWFRRVETLLAALVFQGSGHEEDVEEVGETADHADDKRSTLEGSFDAENTLSFDLGQQILDTNFQLPSMGSQFPKPSLSLFPIMVVLAVKVKIIQLQSTQQRFVPCVSSFELVSECCICFS